MNLANEPIRAVPKPSYGRRKPTARQRGNISPSVSKEVIRRSGNVCERCGWTIGRYDPTGRKMGLQNAHLLRRHKIEGKTEPWDVARLCGPSVNTGTCHWWIDHTRDGREWAAEYREKLIERYREFTPEQEMRLDKGDVVNHPAHYTAGEVESE
jgi:hypothetical protein